MSWRYGRRIDVVLSWMADIMKIRRNVSVRWVVLWLIILIGSHLPDCGHVK